MRPKGTPQELFERRLRAVKLVLDAGYSRKAAGRVVGAHRNSVKDWVDLYEAGGEQALTVKPPGYAPKITAEQAQEIVEAVLRGPRANGFDTELWTLRRIGQIIERRFGVTYDEDHLSRLVRSWGLSWQKPATVPIERDQQAIDHWVEHEWPRIKKSEAASRTPGFHR